MNWPAIPTASRDWISAGAPGTSCVRMCLFFPRDVSTNTPERLFEANLMQQQVGSRQMDFTVVDLAPSPLFLDMREDIRDAVREFHREVTLCFHARLASLCLCVCACFCICLSVCLFLYLSKIVGKTEFHVQFLRYRFHEYIDV